MIIVVERFIVVDLVGCILFAGKRFDNRLRHMLGKQNND